MGESNIMTFDKGHDSLPRLLAFEASSRLQPFRGEKCVGSIRGATERRSGSGWSRLKGSESGFLIA